MTSTSNTKRANLSVSAVAAGPSAFVVAICISVLCCAALGAGAQTAPSGDAARTAPTPVPATQNAPPPRVILDEIRASFERNIDAETFCRKDSLPAKGQEEQERWIVELMTCLGTFAVNENAKIAAEKELSNTKKELDALLGQPKACNLQPGAVAKPPGGMIGRSGAAPSGAGENAGPVGGGTAQPADLCDPASLRSAQDRATLAEAEVALLEERVVSAESDVARLERRLKELGFSSQAGFTFTGEGDDPTSSTAEIIVLEKQPAQGRWLTSSECPTALDWLLKQPAWYFPRIWVFDNNALRLCERTASGDRVVAPTDAKTEAHTLLFR